MRERVILTSKYSPVTDKIGNSTRNIAQAINLSTYEKESSMVLKDENLSKKETTFKNLNSTQAFPS